jgi:SRSO17 transposase
MAECGIRRTGDDTNFHNYIGLAADHCYIRRKYKTVRELVEDRMVDLVLNKTRNTSTATKKPPAGRALSESVPNATTAGATSFAEQLPSVVQLRLSPDAEKRLEAFVLTPVAKVLGHVDRVQPLRAYCKGLLVSGGRKNIEQIAALMTTPENLHSVHQSLHHFIANAAWDDDALLRRVHAYALRQIEASGAELDAWVVTDVGLIKKGKETVGITRKFCARQDRRVNCQSAVMVLACNERISLPLCLRLYLPEPWAVEPDRRHKGGVPDSVDFCSRPEIAIEQIRRAIDLGLPPRCIVANETYGDQYFQSAVTDLGLQYVVRVPGGTIISPEPASAGGSNLADDLTVKALAAALPTRTFVPIFFRTPTGVSLSQFASIRVRHAHRNRKTSESPGREKWLLVERPADGKRPETYWLSTLPASHSTEQLARAATRYWSAEIAYFDLKDHLGLGHYEGRGWRGFHHHAALCIAVYGFLVAEFARASRHPAGFVKRQEAGSAARRGLVRRKPMNAV